MRLDRRAHFDRVARDEDVPQGPALRRQGRLLDDGPTHGAWGVEVGGMGSCRSAAGDDDPSPEADVWFTCLEGDAG